MGEKGKNKTGLLLIAAFKLFKGLVLVAVGIGALALLHKDVADILQGWIEALRVDPGNRYMQRLLVKAGLINDRKLEEISAGTFFYASLLLTEGTGLLLRKRWAEYLTVIATASFIPLEIYELTRKLSFTRFLVIGVNIAIVWYLVVTLRRERRERSSQREEKVQVR